jgi:hypothetical protein
VIVRIPITIPTPFPLLQPHWGTGAGRVGLVKLKELVRAILKATCVAPRPISLVSKPFSRVLSLSTVATGFEYHLYLIFFVSVCTAVIALSDLPA